MADEQAGGQAGTNTDSATPKRDTVPRWYVVSVASVEGCERLDIMEGPMCKDDADKRVRELCRSDDIDVGAMYASIRFGLRGTRGTRSVTERKVTVVEREVPAFVPV